MNSRKNRFTTLRLLRHWLVFSVGLALLQVWIGWLYRWLTHSPGFWDDVLLDGSLLFFANAVAMGVLARRWDELQIMIGIKRGRQLPPPKFLFYELFLPMLVLGLAVTVYCVILEGSTVATSPGRVIFMQFVITLCALLVGALHEMDFRLRFEVVSDQERSIDAS